MKPEEAQVDVAFINSKTRLAITLAVGGMLTLVVGLVVLVLGATHAETTAMKVLGMEVSASGTGAVIMVTSSIWAFFAYKARPQYSRRSERSETVDPESGVRSTYDRESATATAVERSEPPAT